MEERPKLRVAVDITKMGIFEELSKCTFDLLNICTKNMDRFDEDDLRKVDKIVDTLEELIERR